MCAPMRPFTKGAKEIDLSANASILVYMVNRPSLTTILLIATSLVLLPLPSVTMGMDTTTDNEPASMIMEMGMGGEHHQNCCPEKSAADHHDCNGAECGGGCCTPAVSTSRDDIHQPASDIINIGTKISYFEKILPIEPRPPRT